MKKIKLIRMEIRNFKGIRNLEIDFNGKNMGIYGDNGTGKTTTFDAYLWLLFGKDSQDKKDFEVKTLVDGEAIHRLEHEVSCVLEVDDHKVKLSRLYKEKWVKKTGKKYAEMDGHTTDYHIDDVPKNKTKYDAFVSDIIDEETFKMISNLTYFGNMKWKEQRDILESIAGYIGEVDGHDKILKMLDDLGRTQEEHEAFITEQKKILNKEIASLPHRIDEVDRMISDKPSVTVDDLNARTADLNAEKDNLKKELTSLDAQNDALNIKLAKINEMKKQLSDIEYQWEQERTKEKRENEQKIKSAERTIKENEDSVANYQCKINGLEKEKEDIEKKLKEQQSKYNEQKKEKFIEPDTECLLCSKCGQSLPQDQKEEFTANAREQFVNEKNSSLKKIENKINYYKRDIQNIDENINDHKKDIELFQSAITKAEETIKTLDLPFADEPLAEPTPEYVALVGEIVALEESLGDKVDSSVIMGKINVIDDELFGVKYQISRWTTITEREERKAELMASEESLNAELLSLEEQEFLMKQYSDAKNKLLEEKVNKRFEIVKFKLFDQLINGSVKPTCEMTVDGVPYNTNLNNGAKINAGLDVINVLSDYFEVSAPIFVDNRESVTKLIHVDSQIISTYVSESDKILRLEAE